MVLDPSNETQKTAASSMHVSAAERGECKWSESARFHPKHRYCDDDIRRSKANTFWIRRPGRLPRLRASFGASKPSSSPKRGARPPELIRAADDSFVPNRFCGGRGDGIYRSGEERPGWLRRLLRAMRW